MALTLVISLGWQWRRWGVPTPEHTADTRTPTDRKWVNKLMGLTLDLLEGQFLRLGAKAIIQSTQYSTSPATMKTATSGVWAGLQHHKRLGITGCQHFYLWGVDGLCRSEWQLYANPRRARRSARPRSGHVLAFIGTKGWVFGESSSGGRKMLFFLPGLLIPLLLHPMGCLVVVDGALRSFGQGLRLVSCSS